MTRGSQLLLLFSLTQFLLSASCGKHTVRPDDADFSDLGPSAHLASTVASVETRAPRAKKLGVDRDWGKKFEANDLKGTLQARVQAAAVAYGLSEGPNGLRLEADFTTFTINQHSFLAGRGYVVEIDGTMRLVDSAGTLFEDSVGVSETIKGDGPEVAFDYFDRAVAKWFEDLETKLSSSPDLVARATQTAPANPTASSTTPTADEVALAATSDPLVRVENHRRKTVGRVFLSTLLGGVFAVGGAIGAHQVMRAACGEDCGAGYLLAEMGAVIVLTPVGTVLGGAALDGLGNYGWAILGSTSAFLAALSANSGGTSDEEARLIGVKALIGAAIAPIMATVIYELGATIKVKKLEREAGIAFIPLRNANGSLTPGMQLSFRF